MTMMSASILVVDDDPNSLFGICQILKDEGYQVIPAESGKKALERLTHRCNQYDHYR